MSKKQKQTGLSLKDGYLKFQLGCWVFAVYTFHNQEITFYFSTPKYWEGENTKTLRLKYKELNTSNVISLHKRYFLELKNSNEYVNAQAGYYAQKLPNPVLKRLQWADH